MYIQIHFEARLIYEENTYRLLRLHFIRVLLSSNQTHNPILKCSPAYRIAFGFQNKISILCKNTFICLLNFVLLTSRFVIFVNEWLVKCYKQL